MVARHYDVGASARTLDWINLGTTMAGIYGVRLVAITARRRAAAQPPRSGPPPMGHNGGPPMNGHDPAQPAAPAEPADDSVIDWSLMTGQRPH